MSATKATLRRAILRTEKRIFDKHTYIGPTPCAVNDCPSLRDRNGQEAAVCPIPQAAASTVPEISHTPALPETGA